MIIRNDRLAAVLVVLGVASLGTGLALESSRSGAAAPGSPSRDSASLTTAVLSARRTPELLVRPQAARRLRAAVAPVMAGVPESHCLYISPGTPGAEPIVAERADTPMPAASNQKILTALAALRTFGPDATFTTEIAATAAPRNGVIEGDLWMIGGGDPIIDSDTYQATQKYGRSEHTSIEAIADQVKEAGIVSIAGSVRGDESRFDTVRTIPTWPDRYLRQNQVGPLSALSVNDARTYPVIAGAASGTPQPAAEPAAYAAQALTELLVARGVSVGGPPQAGIAPQERTKIVEIESLPVARIMAEMLTFSDNTTAELVLKQLGLERGGAGTTEAGIAAVTDVLREEQLPLDGVQIVDGSGLDTGNRVTCRLLADALIDDGPAGPLAAGLAIADGDIGTLRDRFTRSPAADRVRAKTGTLREVTALSGWVRTTTERDVVFSFVVNTGGREVADSDLRAQQQVAEAILSYPDAVDPTSVAPEPVQ